MLGTHWVCMEGPYLAGWCMTTAHAYHFTSTMGTPPAIDKKVRDLSSSHDILMRMSCFLVSYLGVLELVVPLLLNLTHAIPGDLDPGIS